jgi:hypothetical protein
VSYGCIRMKSTDVVELFDMVNIGTQIEITQDKVGGMFGSVARRPSRLAPVAAGPPELEKPQTLAGPGVLPKTGADRPATFALSAKRSETVREPRITRGESGQVKLLETSGLTINFGGAIESSDRPQ